MSKSWRQVPKTKVAPQCISSMPADGAKNNSPTYLKEAISRQSPNESGLQKMLARKMRSSFGEDQTVQSKGGVQSIEQTPSSLVFSAERYVAHKQASATGFVVAEPKTLKIDPLTTCVAKPKMHDKVLFYEKNVLTRENFQPNIVESR